MTRERLLAGLGVGAIAAALVVTAAREARAAGEDVEPSRSTTQDLAPAARPPPAPAPASQTSASPAAGSSATPAAWSPPRGPRVTAGVLARAASRRAREREEASPAEPERRRAERAVISVEIDWHATSQAP